MSCDEFIIAYYLLFEVFRDGFQCTVLPRCRLTLLIIVHRDVM